MIRKLKLAIARWALRPLLAEMVRQPVAKTYLLGRADERADLVAMLRSRGRQSLRTRFKPRDSALAADRAAQIAVMIEMIEADLHVFEAVEPGGCAPPVMAETNTFNQSVETKHGR